MVIEQEYRKISRYPPTQGQIPPYILPHTHTHTSYGLSTVTKHIQTSCFQRIKHYSILSFATHVFPNQTLSIFSHTHNREPLHTRDREPVTIALQARTLIGGKGGAGPFQVRFFTLRLRDQRSV